MKTRIILDSFNALSFAVVPVACPAPSQDGAGSNPIGHVLPHSLEEWFTSRGALEICGMVTAESTNVLERDLLNQLLARSRCSPSRHRRTASPFAGEFWPGVDYEDAGSGR